MKNRLPVALVSLLSLASCLEAPKAERALPQVNAPLLAVSGQSATRSQLHRDTGTEILTTAAEASAAGGLPVGYNDIPAVRASDDGRGPTTTVKPALHNLTTCGNAVALGTVAARAADCLSKNGPKATWLGRTSGNAGEGNWKLLLKTGTQEIWWDESTNLLWTDALSRAAGWCEASGNVEGSDTQGGVTCVRGNDREDICVNREIAIPGDEVNWRLPTRGDFLQADINGARFVLPSSDLQYWTATVDGTERNNAWTIVPATGVLASARRDGAVAVRCVGRILPQ
jgi:hypothetical protein